MGLNRFGPGCQCCGCTEGDIGFELLSNSYITLCFDCNTVLENLAASADFAADLAQVDAVFCGAFAGSCDPFYDPITFNEIDHYAALKTWVEGGGRLCIVGEYGVVTGTGNPWLGDCSDLADWNPGPPPDFSAGGCISDDGRTHINDLLTYLGSTMSINNDVVCGENCEEGTVESISLNTGLSTIYYHGVGVATVNGGTVVSRTARGNYPWLAIEQIGSGYVLLSGDANFITLHADPPCDAGFLNCQFFRNFVNLGSLL